jgi:tryptophan halogenase
MKMPALAITVLRSVDMGIIGVGEGTTGGVTQHLHGYLGINPAEFLRQADPMWKAGVRFLWGPRPMFDYSFGFEIDTRYRSLNKPTGYYLEQDMTDFGIYTAMMSRNKVFRRDDRGEPIVEPNSFAYHLENETFVRWLVTAATRLGVTITDGTVQEVRQNEHGIADLQLADGRSITADFFVDASGFRRLLVHQALGIPLLDYSSSLWCDRALVGGWDRREGEAIQPYTVAETMNAGWSWRIDHARRINRGYVFCSAYLSEEKAEQEFREKNPSLGPTRLVRFPSGRLEKPWVKNVVAIGNAFGFVEPLEATSLAMICMCCRNLAEMLADGDRIVRDTQRTMYNRLHTQSFDRDRWFLALHYKFNSRLATPFWKDCTEKVDVSGIADTIAYYKENGPSTLFLNSFLQDNDPYGPEGYLSLLIGQQVPYDRTYQATASELASWTEIRRECAATAQRAVGPEEALCKLSSPTFQWRREWFTAPNGAVRSV